ncbi:MAG: phage/plasmid primase, P4 family [Firmicutes bacterium]|nr:phage/plasmid primase, P4 family [Bacillota bacterium]
MDYFTLFKEKHIEDNEVYPHNDIGVARLFFDLHSAVICYVVEAKTWYTYSGKRWIKDEGNLWVMERCKDFAQALIKYAETMDDGSEESVAFIKYTSGFHGRRRREGLLSDARSIAPKSLSTFDRNRLLFNCQNGTFDLRAMKLRPHSAADYITKISNVQYTEGAVCARWERFIAEVMCGDANTARFLQKALGYCLSGETALECFFILYGNTTRNGKSTLSETVAHVLGEYARTIQPQTLSRRPSDGAAASPDIARLKGARLVNMPEPEKGLELNTALVKQLTGGDTYTGRFLHENPVEYAPEFKIFVNTNHLPRASDNTVFSSGRVKLIPFDRHFTQEEQDTGLKKLFRQRANKSGIFNWLVEGYRLLMAEGLDLPPRVAAAINEYRQEADTFGAFLCEYTTEHAGSRLPTSELYSHYANWAKDNGYRQMNNKNFVAELRRRYDVRRDGATGNVVVGLELFLEPNPFAA